MSNRVQLSASYEIVLPAAIRQQLQLEPGDELAVEVRDGYLILIPEPSTYVERLRGLHREIWQGIEPQDYVRQERESWQP